MKNNTTNDPLNVDWKDRRLEQHRKQQIIKKWHDAYQIVLAQIVSRNNSKSSSDNDDDMVTQIFESFVGKPPQPSDEITYDTYTKLLQDLKIMNSFHNRSSPRYHQRSNTSTNNSDDDTVTTTITTTTTNRNASAATAAITVFGSARLNETDEYYQLAVRLGNQLAATKNIGDVHPVRTGAGPGIMDAVPFGFKQEQKQDPHHTQKLCIPRRATQGIRIELPFEQQVSPNIDQLTYMKTFAIRRSALIWNSYAIIVLPGGLGTINEFLECWIASVEHKISCPILMLPTAFYQPFLQTLENSTVNQRQLIHPTDFNVVQSVKDEIETIDALRNTKIKDKNDDNKNGSTTHHTLRERLLYLRHELGRGLTKVSQLPSAVVIIGARNGLTQHEIMFVARLTQQMVRSDRIVRVGSRGMVDRAIQNGIILNDLDTGGRDGTSKKYTLQRFVMYDDQVDLTSSSNSDHNIDYVTVQFRHRVAYREVLIHNAKALVMLPGDLGVLDVLFAALCEMQTGRRPKCPIYLVGYDFWNPIIQSLQTTLTGKYEGQFISKDDLDILSIIDIHDDDYSNNINTGSSIDDIMKSIVNDEHED